MSDGPKHRGRGPRPPDAAGRRDGRTRQAGASGQDDPLASGMARTIMATPEYRLADEDTAFLKESDARGLRLQLEYLKAETHLRKHGIDHGIVVFGSTRVPEPAAARRRVAELEELLPRFPGNAEFARKLDIARRIEAKSRFYEISREFGRIVGTHGKAQGNRLAIVTGGGPGLIEAANRGAHDVGAKTVGLNISLPHEQHPNPYLTPGLCFQFRYFSMRKLHFLLRARALVVFPGGFGTMDELFETLTLVQTRKVVPLPIVLVGRDYWRKVFDVDFLVEEGVIQPEDRELFCFAETAREIWDSILRWYERAGRPLIGDVKETPGFA